MSLSAVEIGVFEKLFKMDGGYVLDFTNKTFDQFISESIKINVRDEEYIKKVEEEMYSSSKANILRYLWNNEPENIVIMLLDDLIEYCDIVEDIDEKLLNKAKEIIKKHKNSTKYILDNTHTEEKIVKLIDDINNSIKNNKPQFTLDRLHTLMIHYLKELCNKHDLSYEDNETNLNPLLKTYANFIGDELESDLSKTIIKQTGSIFDKFNYIRNNQSYAHDNNILNEAESLLVFRDITNVFEFIKTIEEQY